MDQVATAFAPSSTADLQDTLFKTKLCTLFKKGRCEREFCSYAHGRMELRAKPDLTKTVMCHFFVDRGYCCAQDCKFAHSEDELRLARSSAYGARSEPARADTRGLYFQRAGTLSGSSFPTVMTSFGGPAEHGQDSGSDGPYVQWTPAASRPSFPVGAGHFGMPAVQGPWPELDQARSQTMTLGSPPSRPIGLSPSNGEQVLRWKTNPAQFPGTPMLAGGRSAAGGGSLGGLSNQSQHPVFDPSYAQWTPAASWPSFPTGTSSLGGPSEQGPRVELDQAQSQRMQMASAPPFAIGPNVAGWRSEQREQASRAKFAPVQFTGTPVMSSWGGQSEKIQGGGAGFTENISQYATTTPWQAPFVDASCAIQARSSGLNKQTSAQSAPASQQAMIEIDFLHCTERDLITVFRSIAVEHLTHALPSIYLD